jgi:hypothetical protein
MFFKNLFKTKTNIELKDKKELDIENNSNLFTIEQIIECIKLLGEDYISLEDKIIISDDITIKEYGVNVEYGKVVFGNYECSLSFNPDSNVFISENPGIISIYLKVIKNCFKNIDDIKVNFIGSLFHELRHAYQRIHTPEVLYNNRNENYWDRKCENDAIDFVEDILKKYRDKINDILEVKNNNWNYNVREDVKI